MLMSVYRGFRIMKDGACSFWLDTGPDGFDYGYFNSESACEEQVDMIFDQTEEEREAIETILEMRLYKLQQRCRESFPGMVPSTGTWTTIKC